MQHLTIPGRLLVGAVLGAATLAVVTPSAAAAPAAQRTPVCLDATNSWADNTEVRLWACLDHRNQKWVVQDGQIKLRATVGTGREVCLDATNSRDNGTKVRLWRCLNHTNQKWVLRRGQIVVADTFRTGREVCLDANDSRANGTNVILWTCVRGNRNQEWVVQDGHIKVEDTL
ncbi:RICIN domain-containing protein [Nonomuraea longicatena]|uniref:Ricin B lectin domain-containing protein n=1 Tax=Nonomuraea longicatena TaxID=83682 RepID=A0ABN1PDW7_9ACTN